MKYGKSRRSGAACRIYMNSTCGEFKIVGRSNMRVTQPYFNLAQAMLEVMQAAAGNVATTFENLKSRFRANIAGKIAAAAERLHRIWLACA